MPIEVVNNRIAGTRITVWDVYDYLVHGESHAEIRELLKLQEDELQAALEFIERNRPYVEQVHQEIEARIARGNPPEIQEKLKQTRAKLNAWREERRLAKLQERNGAGDPHRR